MQEEIITIQTDPLGNDVVVPEIFTQSQNTIGRSLYEGPGHTLEMRETMSLSAVAPKPNAISRGSAKSSIKLIKDMEVLNPRGDGDIKMAAVIETSFSLPIGITDDEAMILCERMCAIIQDQVVRTPLVRKLHT